MISQWLQRTNNERLILLFLGWGTDANCVSEVRFPDDADVVALWDYSDMHLLQDIDLEVYRQVSVVAWSMGVFAATEVIHAIGRDFFCSITAINGTMRPVDSREGIAPEVVRLTRDNWSETTRMKFNLRMFGGRAVLAAHTHLLPQRDIENQREELSAIMLRSHNSLNYSKIIWDKAIIGTRDLIFLPDCQRNFWRNNRAKQIVETDMPHFPFLLLNDTDNL